MYDVIIIGGGLAGLISGIILAGKGRKVILFEKKSFPFQKVCGEYISNEVLPFLVSIGCYPDHIGPAQIDQFQLTSINGKSVKVKLELGGFGVSRYKFDHSLAEKARNSGVEIEMNTMVRNVSYSQREDHFLVTNNNGRDYQSRVVIGAFGKRSIVDKSLDREFMKKRSPYVGVKYHIRSAIPPVNQVALHNFNGGYCGVSKIEDDKFNLCYLASRDFIKKTGSILSLENEVLRRNPFLEEIFKNSDFLFDQPEVINEVSFARKEAVFNHILMSGDAAGMIAPLCGNGMAMAIHSGKICSEITDDFLSSKCSRLQMEEMYAATWKKQFALRLWLGRNFQKLFGSGLGSDFAVSLLKKFSQAAKLIIRQTHGKPF